MDLTVDHILGPETGMGAFFAELIAKMLFIVFDIQQAGRKLPFLVDK
jgi:hypothetical protein